MSDMAKIAQSFLGSIWDLFSGVTLPGFGVSAAKVFIGFFIIKFSLNLLGALTGLRTNVDYSATSFRRNSEAVHHYRSVLQRRQRTNQ